MKRGLERDSSIISLISSRIIYSAFVFGGEIATRLPAITNDCFLYEVLGIISTKLHERLNIEQSIPIPLVLAFDEYQYLIRHQFNLNTDLQHKIRRYMRNYQKKHRLILFPTLSGTLLDSDINFTSIMLSLPSLRPEDIEIILKEEGLEDLFTPKYKIVWSIIGLVPRHLEWAVWKAKSRQHNHAIRNKNKLHLRENCSRGVSYISTRTRILRLSISIHTYSFRISI